MHKKSSVFKKALSLILTFVMVCGMMVFTANAAATDTFTSLKGNGDNIVVKGVIEGIGTTTDDATTSNQAVTEIKLSELTAGKKINVHYYVYLNDAYDAVYTMGLTLFNVTGLTSDAGGDVRFYSSNPYGNEFIHSKTAQTTDTEHNQKYQAIAFQDDDNGTVLPNTQNIIYKWNDRSKGLFYDFVVEYTVSSVESDITALKTAIEGKGTAGYEIPMKIAKDKQNNYVIAEAIVLDPDELAANPNSPELAGIIDFPAIAGDSIKLIPAKIVAKDENATINYDFGPNFDPTGTFLESKYKNISVPKDQDYTVDPDFNDTTVTYNDPSVADPLINPDGTMILVGWDTDNDPTTIEYEPGDTIPKPVGDTTLVAVYDEKGIIGPRSDELVIVYKLRNTTPAGYKDDTKGLTGRGILWPTEVKDASGKVTVGVKVAADKYSAAVSIPKTSLTQTTGTITSQMHPTGADLKTSSNPKENWLFEGYFTDHVDKNGTRFNGTDDKWESIVNKSFTNTNNQPQEVYIYLTNGDPGDDKRDPIDLVITYPDTNTPVHATNGNDDVFKGLPKDLPYEIYEPSATDPTQPDKNKPVKNSQDQPSKGVAENVPNDKTKQQIPLDLNDIPDPTKDSTPPTDNDRRPVAKNPDGTPKVTAQPVDEDGDGKPDKVIVLVTYEDSKVPLIPNNPEDGPVVDDTDDPQNPNDPVDPTQPINEPVDRIAVILFMSDGQLLPSAANPTKVVIKDNIDNAGRAVIPQNAYPSNFKKGAPVTGYGGGKNFLDWKFTGARDASGNLIGAFRPDSGTYGGNDPRSKEFYYIMEAEFENTVKLTVTNDVTDKDTGVTTEDVPVIGPNLEVDPGTYVKVVDDNNNPFVNPDDNNNPAVFGPVNTDSTWEIPEGVDKDVNVKAPRKGDKIFDGNYEPDMENGKPKVVVENGQKVIYVRPVYVDPDDVIIIPPPVDDDRDGLTTDGKGYTVLKGAAFANDTANIKFRVAFKGANGNLVPAGRGDISKLSRTAVNDKKFEKFTTRSFGQFVGDISFDKVEDNYGVFNIKYQMNKSAVVKVTMTCTVGTGANAKSGSNDHYVITTGDYNADTRVTTLDSTIADRMFYNDLTKPKKASELSSTSPECLFEFELLDMNKDGRITTLDSTIQDRMFYKDLTPSN